ncbi:hypothetical protein KUTeg_003782 [Tegillarca granosa]|uniref:TGF-beta propeptide domain-containing protein n=1 Tax=Tegillarca granosa TaxID=220873 RepID=A0ABQ9FPR4_TEGGR|nr:hypothetical protein KUTeg_003782 [Tegillarca granosa]
MTSFGHTWTAMVESVWSGQFRVSKVLYLIIYIVIICSIPSYGKKHKLKEISVTNQTNSDTNQTEVIERLSRFFGIDKVPVRVFHKAPPQYMLDLYNSITELGGLMKRDSPYNADVIRSFPDRQWNQQMLFYYNVSYLKDSEKILAAEFHVFKMRPRPSSDDLRETKPPHVIEIKVYEIKQKICTFISKGQGKKHNFLKKTRVFHFIEVILSTNCILQRAKWQTKNDHTIDIVVFSKGKQGNFYQTNVCMWQCWTYNTVKSLYVSLQRGIVPIFLRTITKTYFEQMFANMLNLNLIFI